MPHGVSLGLGGADRPDPARLAALGERAVALGAPLVTEHIAFVRRTSSPALEAGHLLPVPRTRDALDVLCENVRIAQDALPVPLALENIAALISWPDEELTEGQFLDELVERTGVRLLVDVANLHTNRVNRGEDPAAVLDAIPLEALAYVHVAGGVERAGVWHDTHAHPVPPVVLDVLPSCAAGGPARRAAGAGRRLPAGGGARGRTGAGSGTWWAPRRTARRRPAPQRPGPQRQRQQQRGVHRATREGACEAARTRVALGQAALLSALVAGTPVPEGFDRQRIRVQARSLAAKRAGVVAKLAPELPEILGGEEPRTARPSSAYARHRPMPPPGTAATP